MITGWGISARVKAVHYYGLDGLPVCKNKKFGRTKAEIALPRWNPEHERTCKRCRKMFEYIQAQESPADMIEVDVNVPV